jgi:hypothetical protein
MCVALVKLGATALTRAELGAAGRCPELTMQLLQATLTLPNDRAAVHRRCLSVKSLFRPGDPERLATGFRLSEGPLRLRFRPPSLCHIPALPHPQLGTERRRAGLARARQ